MRVSEIRAGHQREGPFSGVPSILMDVGEGGEKTSPQNVRERALEVKSNLGKHCTRIVVRGIDGVDPMTEEGAVQTLRALRAGSRFGVEVHTRGLVKAPLPKDTGKVFWGIYPIMPWEGLQEETAPDNMALYLYHRRGHGTLRFLVRNSTDLRYAADMVPRVRDFYPDLAHRHTWVLPDADTLQDYLQVHRWLREESQQHPVRLSPRLHLLG